MPIARSRRPAYGARRETTSAVDCPAAALDLFSEQGYDKISLDQVAAAAGFSKGAIYSNFASKDDLFVALMDSKVQERISQALEALSDADDDLVQNPRLVGRRLTAALIEDRDWQLLFLTYVGRAARDPAIGAQFVTHRRRVRQLIADTVREFLSNHDASLNVDSLATTILALSNGLAIERLTDPESVPDNLLGHILEKLLPPSEPVP